MPAKLSQVEFIKLCSEKHNNFYNYSKTIYTKGDNEITIICPLHGDFKQLARKHLEGRGCVKCSRAKASLKLSKEHNTFLREGFINKSKNNLATLYIIQCFNETESFYKIGITTKTVKERYNSSRGMPYLYKIIEEIHGDAGTIYDLEVKLKNQMASYHIVPAIKFNGCKTECFSQAPLFTTPLDVNKNKSVYE